MKKSTVSALLAIPFLLRSNSRRRSSPERSLDSVFLSRVLLNSNVCTAGFGQGLRELGYVDGRNIVIESRYGEPKSERLRDDAVELVRGAPDIIWTHSTPAVLAAKQATRDDSQRRRG